MTEILHVLDTDDALAMTAMRAFLAANPIQMSRETFDRLASQTPDAEGVTYAEGSEGGVAGVWCTPANARADAVLLYLHGDVYRFGSAGAFRHFAGQIAARASMSTFVADYRLAPEHPFPAAALDARAAYRALRERGLVGVIGDSAGGGLALGPLAGEDRAPFAGVLLSPWVDLALTGESLATRAHDDPLLTRAALEGGASAYLNGHDARDPRASPLYADLAKLPPVQIHVGTAEILLDDARRLAPRATIQLHIWEGMPHVFPRNVTLKAAREALDLIGQFLKNAL